MFLTLIDEVLSIKENVNELYALRNVRFSTVLNNVKVAFSQSKDSSLIKFFIEGGKYQHLLDIVIRRNDDTIHDDSVIIITGRSFYEIEFHCNYKYDRINNDDYFIDKDISSDDLFNYSVLNSYDICHYSTDDINSVLNYSKSLKGLGISSLSFVFSNDYDETTYKNILMELICQIPKE